MPTDNPPSQSSAPAAPKAPAYKPAYRILPRLFVLTIGFMLVTYGALDWLHRDLNMAGILFYDNDWEPHPLHLLVAGLCVIPIAMWEILAIDLGMQGALAKQDGQSQDAEDANPAAAQETEDPS